MGQNASLQLRSQCTSCYYGFLVALKVKAGFCVCFRNVFVQCYDSLAVVQGLVVGNGAFRKLFGGFGIEHHYFLALSEICVVPQNVFVFYFEFVCREYFLYCIARHFYMNGIVHGAFYVAIFNAWLMFVAFQVHSVAASRHNSVVF